MAWLKGFLLFTCAVAALLGVALPTLLDRLAGTEAEAVWTERGVRLGMSEEQVRAAFVDSESGAWVRGRACGGPSLEWTRTSAGSPTGWARFELHEGMVVAMRLHLDGVERPPRAEQARSAVRQVRHADGGAAVTVIARGCSTHRAEAEQIAVVALADRSAW